MTKKPRERIPQSQVLEWLQQQHPQLHTGAEIDRAWIWLTTNLQGEHNKPIRESLKSYGFIFHRKGGHHLSSGKLGMWGHSCLKPLPFKRKGKPNKSASSSAEPTDDTENQDSDFTDNPIDSDALAFLNS
ncbi:hypothetical protein [Pedosphaera parvula]|uniref:Uncharacterized protein n=1 Tax=Pedosphaera parvula (strain Ellin514) TaxID=320771 RepID=B9XA15_PEDPL|nr:hypothetical protein [Pedosphaera parvula]EEF63356.1 hypothetical protein Cflav_PD5991 [Pedosphaera parvula Ellin514]